MELIEGVKIKHLIAHQDISDTDEKQNGFLIEVLRDDEKLLSKLGQTTFTVALSGELKAFHQHQSQEDLWFFCHGAVIVVLYDMRQNTQTPHQLNTFLCGPFFGKENKEYFIFPYVLIKIPPMVAHGYKVISPEPAFLFYHTNNSYDKNNPDEIRIDPYDKEINFPWKEINNAYQAVDFQFKQFSDKTKKEE